MVVLDVVPGVVGCWAIAVTLEDRRAAAAAAPVIHCFPFIPVPLSFSVIENYVSDS
jgi:hypothetical protein